MFLKTISCCSCSYLLLFLVLQMEVFLFLRLQFGGYGHGVVVGVGHLLQEGQLLKRTLHSGRVSTAQPSGSCRHVRIELATFDVGQFFDRRHRRC